MAEMNDEELKKEIIQDEYNAEKRYNKKGIYVREMLSNYSQEELISYLMERVDWKELLDDFDYM